MNFLRNDFHSINTNKATHTFKRPHTLQKKISIKKHAVKSLIKAPRNGSFVIISGGIVIFKIYVGSVI